MKNISVVMATYNGAKYIFEQINSILNQSWVPNELVICDDCSFDDTMSIIDSIEFPNNIKVIIKKNDNNLGYIKNFRQAISLATGDYIFLCDQDDRWHPDKVKFIVDTMDETEMKLICTGMYLIDSNGDKIENTSQFDINPICGYKDWTNEKIIVPFKRIIWGNFSPGCTYCVRRELVDIYLKFTNTEVPHDFQLFLIASNINSALYIDTPLTYYRLHSENTIGMSQKKFKKKKYFKPRLIRFFDILKKHQKINDKFYAYLILYMRLPAIYSYISEKLKIEKKIKLNFVKKWRI